jgi:hypothetical protein
MTLIRVERREQATAKVEARAKARATAKADSCGMTNKKTSDGRCARWRQFQ